jgi:hypothetical protein
MGRHNPFSYLLRLCLFITLFVCSLQAFSQSNFDSLANKINPQKWSGVINKKVSKIECRLIAKSDKTLNKLQKQEEKVYKNLPAKDSVLAKSKLAEIKEKYSSLSSSFTNPPVVNASNLKQYIPKLDTLINSLKLLDKNGVTGNVTDALKKASQLQNSMNQAEQIKKFIKERREQLKHQLEQLGIVKNLKQINKQVYYYSAQIKEYQNILKDSKKIERKALDLLSKTKVFQDFMKKNSILTSLFRMPGSGDPNDPAYLASLAGLQTRAQVNNIIQQQVVGGGPNAAQAFQQNLQAAQSQLNELKSKVLKSGGGNSNDIMPEGFKPNDQKTKTFFQRLEYGTNFQTQKARTYFPVTSDIGLSAGYKINNKSIVGIGASYKLGLGSGWRNIKFTQEGAGLRTFIDWKLKGSFWISGGWEANYRTVYNSVIQLKDLNAWQQSGLIGISKSIPVKTKFFKKTKLLLLWDFMSYQQIPKTQPLLFRMGYNF